MKPCRLVSIQQLIEHFSGLENLKITPHPPIDFGRILSEPTAEFDMSEVRGQEEAKEAVKIAAAGGHNVFFAGAAGIGENYVS